ncbi:MULTISPECIES: hypothetical protein [Bacillus cereus group]|uniref:hypothetical protein n=1 Tax=Bacillus cereus group TaxID=86661 RepID=UPI000BEB3564|nr:MULTISPECIES: hypothetical protein [Bacillus cereus group]MCC6082064.1 hypothetical protein [Bacillus thuringiensis]PEB54488.1 hypothetical protein COM79_24985 [Bacillus cereus]PEB85645.1 hypothetical protein COM94_19065 [Bacillus thuringiensis]PGK93092.1 hypothetical protein CN911_21245 [Bacillus thuringiensis]PGV86392.1 hypothetical protein COD85_13830 [Bacillus thuringiensis]
MKNYKTTKSGALFLCGEEAKKLVTLKKGIEVALKSLNYIDLWLPSLVHEPAFHPQNVDSGHKEGSLVHAACLPFFKEIDEYENNVYFGFNRVHRLEPLRSLNTNTRLEAFEVAEVIITGDVGYTSKKYEEVKHIITKFLESHLNGTWVPADDSFIQKYEKEEWIFGEGTGKVAIASGNKHGRYFSSQRHAEGTSCCFGIGIERLYEAIERREQ